VHRNVVLGVLRLHFVNSPVHETALNKQKVSVEIFPLKRRNFAYAKTEALGNKHHRAERLFELRHDELELVRSKDRWALPTL